MEPWPTSSRASHLRRVWSGAGRASLPGKVPRGRCPRGRCQRFLGKHTQLSRLLADSNVCPDHCDSFRSPPASKSPRGPFRGGCCSDRPPSLPTSSSASSERHRPSTACHPCLRVLEHTQPLFAVTQQRRPTRALHAQVASDHYGSHESCPCVTRSRDRWRRCPDP